MKISRFLCQLGLALAMVVIQGQTGTAQAQTQSLDATSKPDSSAYVIEIQDGAFTSQWTKNKQPADLRHLVDVLREEHTNANIVVAPEVDDVSVNDLKLRATTLEAELEAFSVASGGAFVWERRDRSESPTQAGPINPATGLPAAGATIDPATGLPIPAGFPLTPPESGGTPLYVLRAPQTPPQQHRRVMAFSLANYLSLSGKNDEDSARNAIRQIQAIVLDTLHSLNAGKAAPEDQPDFKFHAGARLLIVIGTPEAIEVTRQVVDALPGQQPHYRSTGGFGGGGVGGGFGGLGGGGGYGGSASGGGRYGIPPGTQQLPPPATALPSSGKSRQP